MKTLIFNGSPRANGDTASLIKAVTDNLQGEIRTVNAYFDDISPCVDCRYCWDNKGCAIADGMQEIYGYIEECDNILIASPVYFSQLTGMLLCVGSRLQTYYCAKHFRGEEPVAKPKRGAVLLAGGGDGAMEGADRTARVLLRHMNARDIFPLVFSHNTNACPASGDMRARAGAKGIAAFFNANR